METVPTTAITEYKATEAAIADIQRFKGLVVDVTNPAGMAEGKSALRQVAAVRIALEKTRKTLKEDVLERGRQIDGQAKPLFARVAEIEDPIKAQIEAEERREEAARQAAIDAEQRRLAQEEADRKAAEARELAEARAKIDAERQALEKAQAAQREVEEKARRDREEADRVAAARIRADEQAARERMDAEQRERRESLAAEEERVRAAGAKVEAERQALADAARAEQFRKDEEERAVRLAEQRKREAEENAAANARREKERQAAELLDAGAMLDTFVERFGHLKPFASVTKAIKALPAAKPAKKAA